MDQSEVDGVIMLEFNQEVCEGIFERRMRICEYRRKATAEILLLMIDPSHFQVLREYSDISTVFALDLECFA